MYIGSFALPAWKHSSVLVTVYFTLQNIKSTLGIFYVDVILNERPMWNYYIENIVAKIALLNVILGIGLKLHGHGNELFLQ